MLEKSNMARTGSENVKTIIPLSRFKTKSSNSGRVVSVMRSDTT